MSKFSCHHNMIIMRTIKYFGCQYSMFVSMLLSAWSSAFNGIEYNNSASLQMHLSGNGISLKMHCSIVAVHYGSTQA